MGPAPPPPLPRTITYQDLAWRPALEITLHEPDARVHRVPEAVLHDLWASLRFDASALRTSAGEPVSILHPGTPNPDAGPDFSNARVRIGGLEWTGDVEIHRTSGEWLEHRHTDDPAYDRVVLHVVLVGDRHTGTLRRHDGSLIPEVTLYPHLRTSLRTLLHRFYAHPGPAFYCAPQWPEVPDSVWRPWARTLGRERLQRKTAALVEAYLERPNLEELLYERVMRALGYAPNADPMLALALRLPLRRLRALPSQLDVEAVLFGASGLVPEPEALRATHPAALPYVEDLRSRFARNTEGEPVRPLRPLHWQFARLRPANFPTRRIAQAAALVGPGGLLHRDPVSRLREALGEQAPLSALRRLLARPEPTEFWASHVRFERPTRPGRAGLGRNRIDAVLLNAVLPVLLLHAEHEGAPEVEDRVFTLFEQMPAAENAVTARFTRAGATVENALEAQGLQELYRTRCLSARCLSCAVGQHLLTGG